MVVKQLNDFEAFKVGMNIEKQGMEFYTKFAEVTKNPETKKVILKLAEDEKEHFELFKQLSEEIDSDASGQPIIGDELIGAYLNSLVDTDVFYSLDDLSPASMKDLSEADAFSIGIQAEKDSILFYQDAARYSTNPSGKKAFERLIKEEKEHLVILKERLDGIKKGGI